MYPNMWAILIISLLSFEKIGAEQNNITPESDQNIHADFYGIPCQGKCRKTEDYFRCETKVPQYTGDYCSESPNTDYMGRNCRPDHPCGFNGKDYSWCYVDADNNWGYCGIILEEKEASLRHLSEIGHTCQSLCVQRSSEPKSECYIYAVIQYTGLMLVWDSCSIQNQTTSSGKKCRSGHTCDFHDQNYQWCYLKESGDDWDYCGKVYDANEKTSKYFTRYAEPCDSFCLDSGLGYNWCWTSNETNLWDYCSVQKDVTIRGIPCRNDDPCSTHGYNYYWCWLEDNSWDYCSIVQLDGEFQTEDVQPLGIELIETGLSGQYEINGL